MKRYSVTSNDGVETEVRKFWLLKNAQKHAGLRSASKPIVTLRDERKKKTTRYNWVYYGGDGIWKQMWYTGGKRY